MTEIETCDINDLAVGDKFRWESNSTNVWFLITNISKDGIFLQNMRGEDFAATHYMRGSKHSTVIPVYVKKPESLPPLEPEEVAAAIEGLKGLL